MRLFQHMSEHLLMHNQQAEVNIRYRELENLNLLIFVLHVHELILMIQELLLMLILELHRHHNFQVDLIKKILVIQLLLRTNLRQLFQARLLLVMKPEIYLYYNKKFNFFIFYLILFEY